MFVWLKVMRNPCKARANVSLYNLTRNTNVSPANRKNPNFPALKLWVVKVPHLKKKREGKEETFSHLT